MFTNPNLIYFDRFVFCSIPRLFVCLRMRMSSSQQYANVYVTSIFYVRGPLRECRSIRPGGSGLPYYCTPPVCVPAVLGTLGVWRLLNKKLPSCKDVKLGQSSSELKKERCELQGEPLLRGGAGSPSGFNFF